jgi:hypothetical protein
MRLKESDLRMEDRFVDGDEQRTKIGSKWKATFFA